MTNPYGISAIGMNPLGGLGLDYSGAYTSFGDPMTMGMMGMSGMNSIGSMGAMGNMGMMGMMGMYNPTFMQQYVQMQNNMEANQVQHSTRMHDALMQAEVSSLSAHDRATFQKISVDGDVQRGIENLAVAVRKGDSDSIIDEYDKLKANILLKYGKELKADKTGNSGLNADRFIEVKYAQILSQQTGQPTSLRDDIKQYGEKAFWNGFNKTFLGNSGHNKKYSEEVLSYIDGNTRINDKGSKERAKKWGQFSAHGAEGLCAAGAGAVAGIGLLGFLKSVPKLGENISFFKNMKAAGWIGAAALVAGDIIWQISRNNESTT